MTTPAKATTSFVPPTQAVQDPYHAAYADWQEAEKEKAAATEAVGKAQIALDAASQQLRNAQKRIDQAKVRVAKSLGLSAAPVTTKAKAAPKAAKKAAKGGKRAPRGNAIGKADMFDALWKLSGEQPVSEIVKFAMETTGKGKPANASAVIATLVKDGKVKDTGKKQDGARLYAINESAAK